MSDEKEDDQKKAMYALDRAYMLGREMEKMHKVLFERVVGPMLHDRALLRPHSLDFMVESVTAVVEHYYKDYYSRKENFVLLAGSFSPALK